MAVKHVKEYYNQICEQYSEMLENIRDLEKEAIEGIVEPERIERLKSQVQPIKQNYERWSYMMFLLNKPARKKKHEEYKRRNQKLLSSLSLSNSPQAVFDENKEALQHIGE